MFFEHFCRGGPLKPEKWCFFTKNRAVNTVENDEKIEIHKNMNLDEFDEVLLNIT